MSSERTYRYGYTAGVYDLFHVGHLNLFRNARSFCQHLIVGVTTDELVSYKGKNAVIPFKERIEVVRGCRYVDTAIAQTAIDKFEAWKKLKFDVLFVGDDWLGKPTWVEYERRLAEVGVPVVYLPYTEGTSSTILQETLARINA